MADRLRGSSGSCQEHAVGIGDPSASHPTPDSSRGLEATPRNRELTGGLHHLPQEPLHVCLESCAAGPALPAFPAAPGPEAEPGQLPLTWAVTGPLPGFQLRFPGASSLPQLQRQPSPAPALLPEELAWPGPTLGRGVWARTGEGRANDDVRQIKSAGRGGEEDRRCVASRDLGPAWGRGGAGVPGCRGAAPHNKLWGGDASRSVSLQAERRALGPMGLEQSCED